MFNQKNLSVLAYANNFTLWHYVTDDNNVLEANYFNNARDMLRTNDLIICQSEGSQFNTKKTEQLIVNVMDTEIIVSPIS